MKRKSKKFLGAVLALALMLGGIEWVPAMDAQAAGSGENLIRNPNFADADMSVWMDTGAQITVESQTEEICSGVTTYATISGRTQSYQGFSQDVTDLVQPGGEYEVSYYVKLSEDYEGLSDSQRQVFFGPYVVVDGETKYLNQSYSGDISGELFRTVPVGQWVQLSGTYKVDEDATQVVVRFQEESSTKKGAYSVTGIVMKQTSGPASVPVAEEWDDGLPALKDAITSALGEDTIVGMVTHPVNNKKEWGVLTKHANAITTGNELKPDYHFGYSNDRCPGTETVTFNGRSMVVPKIKFSGSDQFLNAVLKYNEDHPDNFIKVRGHVLVWHAQTPEWFFHEDYDPKKDYVSKEEMDRRLEWYIKSLFEHYLGEDSKYRELFYGWDVVNEACADSDSQVYRDDKGGSDKLTDSTHNTKSSWWHIYQSNEYIINAFKYANKYAPADVELYYNDYNDSWPVKVPNICELLKAVKAEEGAPGVGTRIDAFGMQAHYSAGDFNVQNFETAARAYLDIVGKIQLTELDMKATNNYDGTEATKDQEYQDQALCYQSIFEVLKKLNAIDGYEVGGITFWGVTDPTSWLQNRNDVGGGSDGLRSQCPLLFDGNYEAKPAYWAFVDPSKIKIVQKKLAVRRSYDGNFNEGDKYSFSAGGVSADIIPMWDENGLLVQVEVKDSSRDGERDYVTVYLDEENRGEEGITPVTAKMNRMEASSNSSSYKAVLRLPLSEIKIGKQLLLDVVVHNGDEVVCFNDIWGEQEKSSRNYASATLQPALTVIPQGTAVVDGEMEEIWNTAATLWLNVGVGNAEAAAKAKLLWDKEKLYLYAVVKDGDVSAAGKEAYEKDSLEIYIDEEHDRSPKYGKDDKRYRISCENEVTCLGEKAKEKDVQSFVKKTEDGYVIEASIAWSGKTSRVHKLVGLDLRLNDANASGSRIGTASWCDATGEAGNSPICFGTVRLAAQGEPREEAENPDAAFATAKLFTASESASQPQEGADSQNPPLEDGKEVEDNPKSDGGFMPVLAGAALVVAAAAAGVILAKRKKKKTGEKTGDKTEDKTGDKAEEKTGEKTEEKTEEETEEKKEEKNGEKSS